MDVIEENMSPIEMLEKIAELEHGQIQLRDLNSEMRQWLDAADEEMALLHSENATLKKQVKVLEKLISEAQQGEAEPCRHLQADDLDVNRCNEKKIQELDKESTMMKEQNKKLTAELKSLQQERDQNHMNLSKLRDILQTLEFDKEEAQSGLQHRDEVINQKNLQLKYLEEIVEECSNIIKDLRLTNQELRTQLEEGLDETSFAILKDQAGENEGPLSPPLSFAEEIKLLACSDEVKIRDTNSTDLRPNETEPEEQLKPHSLTVDLQTKRCADTSETSALRTWLFLLCIFILTVLAFVALRSCVDIFSPINSLWSSAHLMFQPYFSIYYGALPPI